MQTERYWSTRSLPPYTPVVRYVRDGGGVAVGAQSVQVVLLTVILHIIVNRPVNVKTRERDLEIKKKGQYSLVCTALFKQSMDNEVTVYG